MVYHSHVLHASLSVPDVVYLSLPLRRQTDLKILIWLACVCAWSAVWVSLSWSHDVDLRVGRSRSVMQRVCRVNVCRETRIWWSGPACGVRARRARCCRRCETTVTSSMTSTVTSHDTRTKLLRLFLGANFYCILDVSQYWYHIRAQL